MKILKYYPYSSKLRVEQAQIIRNHQKTIAYPSILCGDLNDTSNSRTFYVMSNGLKDSFREKGIGIGKTFNSWNKILRLDYILVNPNLTIQNHQIVKSNLSDHYLVKSDISLWLWWNLSQWFFIQKNNNLLLW